MVRALVLFSFVLSDVVSIVPHVSAPSGTSLARYDGGKVKALLSLKNKPHSRAVVQTHTHTHPGRQVAVANKFYTVATNIFG
jgi:hypothetical protein